MVAQQTPNGGSPKRCETNMILHVLLFESLLWPLVAHPSDPEILKSGWLYNVFDHRHWAHFEPLVEVQKTHTGSSVCPRGTKENIQTFYLKRFWLVWGSPERRAHKTGELAGGYVRIYAHVCV